MRANRVIGHAARVLVASFLLTLPLAEARAQGVPQPGETPLSKILDDRRVINTHEHLQNMANAEMLLAAMDRNGIAKSVLVGSSLFTLRLDERSGFTQYDENNEELMRIVTRWPGRFEAWPTLDPLDPKHLEKIQDLIARGASGVKLYLGHGYRTYWSNRYMFHVMAMDDARMIPLYAWCEKEFVPMCIHVNSDRPGFADEFISVLNRFPDLKVNCPHFMLSTIRDSRLREYLKTYPNLYADISFGHDDFLRDGLRRISREPEKYRRIFREYPDRFFFGTDYVLTNYRPRDGEWFDLRTRAYYDMLSKESYSTPMVEGEELHGLALPEDLLANVLFRNFEAFKAKQPAGTVIEHELDWGRMRTWRYDREPGEMLPPPSR